MPGRRGAPESARIAATIRFRALLLSTASSSLAAEVVIRTLYFSTLAEGTDQAFEVEPGFLSALLERRQIFRIFRKRSSDRFVHDLGDGPGRNCRLQA